MNFDIDVFDRYKQSMAGLMVIDNANELYEMERKEVAKHEKLRDLTLDNLIKEVQCNVHYEWAELFIEDAQKWISMQATADKRKKHPEKIAYQELTTHINRIFTFIDTIQIVNIITYGYDAYGYRIEFIRKDSDYVYLLDIPISSKCNKTNIMEFNRCKLRFGFMSQKGCMKYMVTSYDIQDLIDGMNTIQYSSQYSEHYSKIEYMENHI